MGNSRHVVQVDDATFDAEVLVSERQSSSISVHSGARLVEDSNQIVEALAAERADVKVVKVDVDASPGEPRATAYAALARCSSSAAEKSPPSTWDSPRKKNSAAFSRLPSRRESPPRRTRSVTRRAFSIRADKTKRPER